MSVDKALREMIHAEIRAQLAPLAAALAELQTQQTAIARRASALGQPLKRGAIASLSKRGRQAVQRAALSGRVDNVDRHCAVMGCDRPARSKGYCAAHYQKYRMLSLSGRLPPSWVDDAAPHSVENIVLPRGRAGAKALAATKHK